MKPYYQDESGITIYHGDCRDVLPRLPGVSVVLTDPPYGIKACDRSDGGVGSVSSGSKVYGRQSWDHKPADTDTIQKILDLDRPTVIWGGNYYELPASSCWLVWDKMQREFTFADAEMAWTNLPKAVRLFSYSRGQLNAEGKVHPTQKPVPLMKWCLKMLGGDGIVLDPFVGSGTTLRAAKDLNRKAIGIEIEEKYCEIAAKRLEQGVFQW